MNDIQKEESLYNSILKDIEKRIEEQEQKKSLKREELRNFKGGFFEKRSQEKLEKQIIERNKDLKELKKQVYSLKFDSKDYFSIPNELKTQIVSFCSNLTEEEAKKVIKAAENVIYDENRKINDGLNKKITEIDKLISEVHLGKQVFNVYNMGSTKPSEFISYNEGLNRLKNLKMNKRNFFDFKIDEPIKRNDDLFEKLEEMIEKNVLEENKNTKFLKQNFDIIKNAYEMTGKCNTIIVDGLGLINELKRHKETDYSLLITNIENVVSSRKKEQEKCQKILRKIDLESLRKSVHDFNKQVMEEERLKALMKHYETLAYELSRETKSNNFEEAKKIQNKMKELAGESGLSDYELRELAIKGENDFENDLLNKKISIEIVKEEFKQERDAKMTIEEKMDKCLTEMARDRIGLYTNSNMTPEEYEKAIAEAKQEIKMESYMTPEDRLVFELKKAGRLEQDATSANLTPQQRMDAKNFYGDSQEMYEYKKLNNELNDMNNNEKAKNESKEPTIYAEYMQAKVVGTTDLSFDDYVKLKNGHFLNNEEMINTNEGRGR